MIVRIDKRNWNGRYTSTVQHFICRGHLNNYLAYMAKREATTKVTGVEVLQD
jgi:hypothetical protein